MINIWWVPGLRTDASQLPEQARGSSAIRAIHEENAAMSTKIFVNLPVKDLARSTEFFTGLGFPSTSASRMRTPAAWSSAATSTPCC
jgi:hypothetical protein